MVADKSRDKNMRMLIWLGLNGAGNADDALIARVRAAGWKVYLALQDTPEGGPVGKASNDGMFVLDMRGSVLSDIADIARLAADKDKAACVAILDEGQGGDARALADMGVSHIIIMPSPDEVVVATLEMAWSCHKKWNNDKAVNNIIATANEVDDLSEARLITTPTGLDWLTGLSGRQSALHWLDRTLATARVNKKQSNKGVAACLLVGISQFDSVNAAYGKRAGDIVLLRVAERISRCTRAVTGDDGLLARMGGTEFMVAIPYRDGQDVEAISRDLARLIISEVARPLVADDKVIRLTSRCGIAETAPEDDGRRLMRRATAALADARRSGSSDIWFRPALRRDGLVHSDSDRLDADLRLALDRGEIGIVYQPQYNSLDDSIIGVEALARWNHPELGQLDAGTLFAAADRSDYLLPLSLHIQRCALIEAGSWPDALKHLRLSINITAVDLAQRDFPMSLEGMIAQSGFPANRLTVEITESGLIENIDRAGQIMQALRAQGMGVAIDDFGTGYSSLAYLKALHPDYLKIDHSLSRDIVGTDRDRVILTAIIAMARSLALTVIAEGVESEEQLTLLARAGCDIYQGFLRSPAVPSEELLRLVAENARVN